MVVSIIKELGTWNGRPKRIRKVVEKNFIAMNCCFYVINSVDLRIMAVYNISTINSTVLSTERGAL